MRAGYLKSIESGMSQLTVISLPNRYLCYVSLCSVSTLFGSKSKISGTGFTATPASYLGGPAYKFTQSWQN